MIVLNNVKIEYEEAENLISQIDTNEVNHLISKLLREEALKRQTKLIKPKVEEKKTKWAKFAEKVHNENLLKGKSQEVINMSKEFRENFIF